MDGGTLLIMLTTSLLIACHYVSSATTGEHVACLYSGAGARRFTALVILRNRSSTYKYTYPLVHDLDCLSVLR